MKPPQRSWLVVLLCMLALIGRSVSAADDDEAWLPSPPRLAYIDGEVSYWRPGAEDWARAQPNLALAEGDALYAGERSNLEVQFGPRSFVRADEDTQLSLVAQEERRIQFSVTTGRASFDLRSIEVGDVLEVSTPNAVFVIDQAGYYRVEVGDSETHFVTRRGGEATVVTTDGRSLGIYPSEEIVVTAGEPAKVATYAAPPPDAWDRWNDARSERYGESISARYLPSDVYGAEELDRHGHWRIVPTYGAVWIPYAVSVDWVPYSTGYWVWDAYYEWTWVDDAQWGWAPFHYGRWVRLDGYWAWAPGPIVRRAVYSPALVGFMVRDGSVSARLSVGLPGLWWVALSWGEPVIPWWGAPRHRGHPRWHGWGGPRIVNNVVVTQTTVINLVNLRFSNAALPRAVLTVPPDRFGREPVRARIENRYRHTDFSPVRGELPVKPSRASLVGGAPKGAQPPREVVARPVVSTRAPRERRLPEKVAPPRAGARAIPDANFVIPPTRRVEDRRALPRPPLGADAGPERTPPPRPPRYEELRGTDRGAPGARTREESREEARERRTSAPQRETAPTRPRDEAAPTPPARRETPGETRAPSRERGEAGPPPARQTPPPARPRSEAPPARRETTREQATTREQETRREQVIERREAPRPRGPAAPSEPPLERGPTTREQAVERREVRPPAPARDAAPPLQERSQPRGRSEDPRGDVRQESRERPLPGQPANRVFRGREPRDAR